MRSILKTNCVFLLGLAMTILIAQRSDAQQCQNSLDITSSATLSTFVTTVAPITQEKDIVDTAVSAKKFNTLVAAVKAAGLVEILKGDGPLTVFAPSDEAFEKLPEGTVEGLLKPENKEKLQAILKYHVVPGTVLASEVVTLQNVQSVEGSNLNISQRDGKVFINDACIVKTDIRCTNGAIHVIDAVVMPPEKTELETTETKATPSEVADIVDTAVAADGFNTLVAAVKAAGLVETLKGDGPFTVFAPTDEAFKKLPEGTLESLLKPENKQKLTDILTYHVVSGNVMASEVVKLENATTVQGQDVRIKTADGTVMINDAKVLKTDIMCKNGVIHVIDSVILPAG